MGNLNIEISEVIKGIRKIRLGGEDLELSYRRLSLKLEELGSSWEGEEYEKVVSYVDQAGLILHKYKRDSEEYLDYALLRLQALMRENPQVERTKNTQIEKLSEQDKGFEVVGLGLIDDGFNVEI